MAIQLKYSKKAVRRAGDYFKYDYIENFNMDQFLDYFEIVENWRSSHAYPMRSMLGYFRSKAFECDRHAIVVQRLKRNPSILEKLHREEGMKLDRMEDVGGCRIVVSSKQKVYDVKNLIIYGSTRNILHRTRDYIKEPKPSGYRGIHLIYVYNGAKKEYNKHKIELQIRSKVQHSWATAVEVVGTFTGQALKASKGHEAWLSFFKNTSIAFADIENKKLAKNADTEDRKLLIKYILKLNVETRLRAFAVSTRHLVGEPGGKNAYYLLTLEIDKSNIKIRRYSATELQEASEKYADLEREFKDNLERDVVLVSASSIHNLKKAYPNYFADTSEFSKYLNQLLETNKKFQQSKKRTADLDVKLPRR